MHLDSKPFPVTNFLNAFFQGRFLKGVQLKWIILTVYHFSKQQGIYRNNNSKLIHQCGAGLIFFGHLRSWFKYLSVIELLILLY